MGPVRRDRVLRLLRSPIDWSAFIALAEVHGLLPLAYAHLEAIAPEMMPRPVRVELWGRHEARTRRNHAMARELLRVLEALDACGIPAIPYKGPCLAASVYGDVALREFGDLDIVVRRDDVLRAKTMLETEGYLAEYPLAPAVEHAFLHSAAQYHLVLRNRERDTMVELHWKTDPDFPVESLEDKSWWERQGSASVEGTRVPAFAPRELFLILCLHGSKHRWASLGWLVDIAEMIPQVPAMDWTWIMARAHGLRCERRLALGLRLAQDVLEVPLPDVVRSWLNDRPQTAPIATSIAGSLSQLDGHGPGALRRLRDNLALYDSARQRIAHCVNTIWTPSLVEWSRWPLPPVLFFLYPPLRLARLAWKHSGAALGISDRSAAKPHLPPGLEHHHRHRVRQVEAAVPGTHRQP